MDKMGAIGVFGHKSSAQAHGRERCPTAGRGKGWGLRHRLAIVAVLATALIPGVSSAEPAPHGARDAVQDFFGRAAGILTKAADAKQGLEDVRDLARALFDGRGASRRALGPEWDQRTGPEQEEFSRLFTAALEHAYLEMLRAQLPHDWLPAIRIAGEEATGKDGAVVRTAVQARNGGDVRFDYMMTRSPAGWRVHDVVIDGVSLLGNYRAQFARILRTSSYADLLARLRLVAGAGEQVMARTEEPVASRSSVPKPGPPPPSAEESVTPAPSGRQAVAATPSADSRPDVVVAYFTTSHAELRSAARRDLDRAAAWLTANRQGRVIVEGHADQRGDAYLNEALATQRANAIREHLVTLGVDGDRITIVTHGDRRPVCREPQATCWAQNRRVVVRVMP
jgi:outer membrane protein OmpA-like peptidoglycan-associated protein